MRQPGRPHSFESATEGYQVGDEKEFSDGSTRQLGYAPSGVMRWLSIGKEDAQNSSGQQQASSNISAVQDYEPPPEGIEKPEWAAFNEFITEDNPFINCSTYSEMVSVWFSSAREYYNRAKIALASGNKEKLRDIDNKLENLDNCFLTVIMYKISYLISKIKEWEPEFDYDTFIQGKPWNALYEYYEQLKAPVEADFTSIYEEDLDGQV